MRLFYKAPYIFILIFFVIFSCSKDSTLKVKFEGDHYANVDPINTLSKTQIENFLMLAGLEYPQALLFANNVISDVEVKKIEYQTKSIGDGTNFVASGLLCYPSEEGSYPVICFHNGTNVLHDEAPSVNSNDQLFLLLESLASMGFVVVIPDYPGFGSSDYRVHPYLIKDETVQSSKDILLATNEYVEKKVDGVTLNNELFLMGYSQGGWAALQLQREIEREGLESFELVASSCGAGPYSISNLFLLPFANPEFSEIPNPYFFAYMMNAYYEYDLLDTLGLEDIFNEPYASRIPGLFNGRNGPSAINDSLSTEVSELIKEEYRLGIVNQENAAYDPVREALVSNDVEAWKLGTKTKLFHGSSDKVVPPQITIDAIANFKMAGTTTNEIEEVAFLGLGHTDAVLPYGLATIEWFLQISGQP